MNTKHELSNEEMKELEVAIKQNNVLEMRKFVETMVNCDQEIRYGYTPLMHASFRGNAEIVELLLSAGANVNAVDINGYSSLHYASRGGYVNIVQILMDYGANENILNNANKTPLEDAKSLKIKEFIANYTTTQFILK